MLYKTKIPFYWALMLNNSRGILDLFGNSHLVSQNLCLVWHSGPSCIILQNVSSYNRVLHTIVKSLGIPYFPKNSAYIFSDLKCEIHIIICIK